MLGDARCTELHDELGLTGCEVSVNDLPAGAAVPFVHAHRQNEELYGILSGAGEIWLDGEVIALRAGDWLRVAPAAKRAIRALPTEAMRFVCIQTKCGSLEGFTMTDGCLAKKRRRGTEISSYRKVRTTGRPTDR